MKRYAFLLACALGSAQGQIHFITGSVSSEKLTTTFGSSLYHAGEDGSVRLVENLVGEAEGTSWIGISHDARKAVLVARGAQPNIVVVDFDSARVSKRCPAPAAPGTTLIAQWVAGIPGDGAYYLQYFAGQGSKPALMRGMSLDASVPCGASFSARRREDLRYTTTHGRTGLADLGSSDQYQVRLGGDGRLMALLAGEEVPLDLHVPRMFLEDFAHPQAVMVTNNHQAFAVYVMDVDPQTRQPKRQDLIGCLKSSGRCTSVPLFLHSFLWSRGFDNYIAIKEAQPRKPPPPVNKDATHSSRITTPGPMGPVVDARMDELGWGFGLTFLFNSESGQVYKGPGGYTDSEILLIQNDTVYYRNVDAINEARITPDGVRYERGGITEDRAKYVRTLAKADVIQNAHWAFSSR
jgi:hypothetical protein